MNLDPDFNVVATHQLHAVFLCPAGTERTLAVIRDPHGTDYVEVRRDNHGFPDLAALIDDVDQVIVQLPNPHNRFVPVQLPLYQIRDLIDQAGLFPLPSS